MDSDPKKRPDIEEAKACLKTLQRNHKRYKKLVKETSVVAKKALGLDTPERDYVLDSACDLVSELSFRIAVSEMHIKDAILAIERLEKEQ